MPQDLPNSTAGDDACRELRLMTGVCATAMHDMLNVLAAVQENAGLLADLLRLDKKLDANTKARFAGIATTIQDQVALGSALAEAVKRYGALLEAQESGASCLPMLRQLMQLARRRARARRLVFEMDERKAPERAGVSARELAFACLEGMEACLAAAPAGATVLVRPYHSAGALAVEWSWKHAPEGALPLHAVDAAFRDRLPGFQVTCQDRGGQRVCCVSVPTCDASCHCTM
ncbi:hypothetical protein [Megalodesulfovibrio gigas]|uniref:Histidine kinase n=1 Tax=Megalodesulfovibrio gigas (strain ATCC 19364 / DSM 1382 / NCIMB 9332 / VKM B-1759) TaxID=1121448 RepID=T2G774_MEGG1|nr:hypothetical protein [Megalodesulfovibrio gigas]AGW12450.1 hypothetical protein DGI_0542 [Megalodesulfovibrio gigas DSM 1382 = ATCC 19364]